MQPAPSPAARRSALRRAGRGRLRLRRGVYPGAIETVIAARVQPEVAHLGPRYCPVQAHVEGDPRGLLGEEGLGPRVDALTLQPEGDLARTDQEIVEPRVAVEGEVRRG